MTAIDGFTLPTGPELEEALKLAARNGGRIDLDTPGVNFPASKDDIEPSLEDKVNYIYGTLKLLEETVVPLLAQVGPLVEQAGPLLATFAPMAAKANSPMGRIFGSLL